MTCGGPMSGYLVMLSLALIALSAPLRASAQTNVAGEQAGNPRDLICQMIERAARANGLPVDFFARVIWQESRFQPDVVGPLTSSGEHAEGIAQFMPGTAVERGLYEPFNPVEALPKSGALLADLRDEFGNLGLAAAAYNAGPQRVRDFLASLRDLPLETRNYVRAITGRPIEDWTISIMANISAPPVSPAPEDCRDLVAQLERAPNPFVTDWEGHKVPSWCRDLHQPTLSVCGPIHSVGPEIRTASAVRLTRSHVHLVRASAR